MIEVRKKLMVTISAEEFDRLLDELSNAVDNSRYGESWKCEIEEEIRDYRNILADAGYEKRPD